MRNKSLVIDKKFILREFDLQGSCFCRIRYKLLGLNMASNARLISPREA